jgi:hypothetical protein
MYEHTSYSEVSIRQVKTVLCATISENLDFSDFPFKVQKGWSEKVHPTPTPGEHLAFMLSYNRANRK